MEYDDRHGGAFDRGGADSYYRRPYDPHYFTGATNISDRVEMKDMTPAEITAYTAGYRDNEKSGNFKEW
ncbi:MAG: hypothetical protein CL855_02085 [Cryomorphaceae bacterium]|nr:hypothetical protein [Cryomorphaceae bacterium]